MMVVMVMVMVVMVVMDQGGAVPCQSTECSLITDADAVMHASYPRWDNHITLTVQPCVILSLACPRLIAYHVKPTVTGRYMSDLLTDNSKLTMSTSTQMWVCAARICGSVSAPSLTLAMI